MRRLMKEASVCARRVSARQWMSKLRVPRAPVDQSYSHAADDRWSACACASAATTIRTWCTVMTTANPLRASSFRVPMRSAAVAASSPVQSGPSTQRCPHIDTWGATIHKLPGRSRGASSSTPLETQTAHHTQAPLWRPCDVTTRRTNRKGTPIACLARSIATR